MDEMIFWKMDGAGNDFVVVDNRDGKLNLSTDEVARICHRRFGVGADGLMTLESAEVGGRKSEFEFEMVYYNSDGRVGSMCGNGGRCIAAFAYLLGLGNHLRFKGFDGPHTADILDWETIQQRGTVRLGMRDVSKSGVRPCLNGWFLDTGSPHYVQRVNDLEHYDVVGEGRRLRNNREMFPEGTNVDFIEERPNGRLFVRTYERGVEDETWACGTGVTACALVTGCHALVTRGGNFRVDFEQTAEAFTRVNLIGPVSLNFKGQWTFSLQ